MSSSRLRPIVDWPALALHPERRRPPSRLVIADVHLGLGDAEDHTGLPSRTTAEDLAEDLARLCTIEQTRSLVIAGDVKHPIVGTPRGLRPIVFDFFSRLLGEGLAVDLVLGNHDVGLAPHVPREVTIHGPEGFVVDGVGIFHGHRWPSEQVLAATTLVVGHLHPGVRLAPSPDRPTGKERCWVRVALRDPKLRRGPARLVNARELVVLPAFNPLAGTEALNRQRPSRGRSFLFQRFLSLGEARAYLLDGTDVGPIPTRPGDRPNGADRRSARAR